MLERLAEKKRREKSKKKCDISWAMQSPPTKNSLYNLHKRLYISTIQFYVVEGSMREFIITAAICMLMTASLQAQDTRGLKLIAKDQKGIPQEINLYQKTYAVIIGIDRYKNLEFNQQLKNAVSDAKGVKAVLQEKFVFDKFFELYNENASKEQILKTLQGDLANISDQDAIFVFFAGHGYTQATKFGDEVGYIVPHDGSMKDNEMFKNISMVELRDNIAKTMSAKHVFFVMDACYSGTLLKRGVEAQAKTVDYAYLKSITQTPVRQVLTAGGKNEMVLDGGYKNHSVFTGRLIEKLEQAENYITASELGLYIPKKVFSDAQDRNHKQNPQFGNLLGEGDFVFIAKASQNVNSEDLLAQELARLQEQNKKLEDQKNLKAQQENLKKQEELKAQMAALEEKKKLEQIEKAKKEQEQLKALEEQKRKQELLAKIEEEKKKQVTIDEGMTYTQAISRISELKSKIEKVENDFDEQKAKAIALAVDESPRGEFETQQEYDQRKLANKQKRKQVADEYDALKSQSKKVFSDEINTITSKKYAIGKERLTFKFGTYNVDGGYFPVTITEVREVDPCDENTITSKLYAAREDAKKLRENESLLDLKATLLVSADQKLVIDKVTLWDAVNSKGYEFTASMAISAAAASSSAGLEILPGDCNRMIFIKGGTFQMGDTFGDGDAHEKPVHTVTVSDFYMSKYEVTQKLWRMVMGNNPSDFKNCDDCPVEKVSWNDAQEFIRKLSAKTGKKYRLPYEAEWEYAARSGGKSEKYAGGSNPYALGWHIGNSGFKTHPVGQKQPNGLGLYDMTGNVWEWCEDWYGENYYSQSSSYNPKGPSGGSFRVLRGGSCDGHADKSRASARFGNIPVVRYMYNGFRIVRE